MNRENLLKKLKEDLEKGSTITAQSQKIGVPFTTLHRILNGQAGGNVRTWDRIEKYYSSETP